MHRASAAHVVNAPANASANEKGGVDEGPIKAIHKVSCRSGPLSCPLKLPLKV